MSPSHSATATWVVRQESVRQHFDQICWVPLGQSPSIEKCHDLLFQQLTGRRFKDSDEREKKEDIRAAMAGRRILLVLDDW